MSDSPRVVGRDIVRQHAPSSARAALQSLYESAEAVVAPELLTDSQAAALLSVSTRTFNDRLKSEPWMPRPVMFGPRCLRWSRSEILAAIAAAVPRQPATSEPAQLLRGRIERAKKTGDLS